MKAISPRTHRFLYLVLVLTALGHADLSATLKTSSPHMFGMGRLGRDLVRRGRAEAEIGTEDPILDGSDSSLSQWRH